MGVLPPNDVLRLYCLILEWFNSIYSCIYKCMFESWAFESPTETEVPSTYSECIIYALFIVNPKYHLSKCRSMVPRSTNQKKTLSGQNPTMGIPFLPVGFVKVGIFYGKGSIPIRPHRVRVLVTEFLMPFRIADIVATHFGKLCLMKILFQGGLFLMSLIIRTFYPIHCGEFLKT